MGPETLGPEGLRSYAKIVTGPNAEGVRKGLLRCADAWDAQIAGLKLANMKAAELHGEDMWRLEGATQRQLEAWVLANELLAALAPKEET